MTTARRGDRDAALRALSLAEPAVTDPPDSRQQPFESYARGHFEYQRAETLLALGSTAQAVLALEHAVAARPHHDRRGMAMTRLRLADVLFSLGRMDEAQHHARVVRDEFGGVRSVSLTREAESLHRALARVTGAARARTRRRTA